MLTALVVILLLVGGVLAFAATRPDEFRIERRATINASPERVFRYLNDFREWTAWSPWEGRDPALRRTYGANTVGRGATYAWAGNSKVGEGRMEIIESIPASKISIKLDFLKPFEAHNTSEFRLESRGAGTDVIWAMFGRNQFMGKVMSLFMNMDNLIGKDFEKGLATLKTAAETTA